MRLTKARVTEYRSLRDTGWFDVEEAKTILGNSLRAREERSRTGDGPAAMVGSLFGRARFKAPCTNVVNNLQPASGPLCNNGMNHQVHERARNVIFWTGSAAQTRGIAVR